MKISDITLHLLGITILLMGLMLPLQHIAAQDRGQINSPAPTQDRGQINAPLPGGAQGEPRTLVNPLKVDSIQELLRLVLDAVVYLGSIVLTLAVIWVGFKFVAAQGNPEKIKEARNALVWTLIGGLILLGAQAISLAIQTTVGSLQAK